MERVLTQEERIRRAEEIYLRRRNMRPQYRESTENIGNIKNNNVKSMKLFKRMVLQIVICLLLYCIFYLIYDTNYSFSDATINRAQEILNYDINFNDIYKYFSEKITSFMNKEENIIDLNNNENNSVEEPSENNISSNQEENDTNTMETIAEQQNQQEIVEQPVVEQVSAVEPDLKQLYGLICPVTGGYISSEFGEREATSEIMSTDHKGIDIAVAERH